MHQLDVFLVFRVAFQQVLVGRQLLGGRPLVLRDIVGVAVGVLVPSVDQYVLIHA